MPELGIVSDEVWHAARARRRAQAERIGAAVRRGIALNKARPPGGVPKYLLSGLLTYAECGSKFIIVNRTSYGCAGHINGKLCGSRSLVKRTLAENLLLAGIREDLLTPEIETVVGKRLAKALAEQRPDVSVAVRNFRPRSPTSRMPSQPVHFGPRR